MRHLGMASKKKRSSRSSRKTRGSRHSRGNYTTGWEAKVERVIGQLSAQAYRAANTDPSGRRYKRHHPYRVPEEAERLVQLLGSRDRKAAEIEAKEIMEGLRRSGAAID